MTEESAPAALLDLARRAAALDAPGDHAMAARVLARLEADAGPLDAITLGGRTGVAATSAPTVAASIAKATVVKIAAVSCAIGVALGGGMVELVHRAFDNDDISAAATVPEARPPAPGLHSAPSPPPAVALAPSAAERAEPRQGQHATRPTHGPPMTPPLTERQRRATLDDERLLIDQARMALLKNDLAAVHEAIAAHRESFSAGALTEERDAIEVLAWLREGSPAADAGIERFRSKWPGSPLLGAIEKARAASAER